MFRLPVFREPLHVGRPNIGDREKLREKIDDALDRRWLSSGPLVRELEERVAALAGTAHAVATCNATVALQLAARATGVPAGAEVIVPSFTWVATPHALDWIGLTPVFCDVDEETAGIDPAHAEKLVGPATGAILGVHAFGRPCPIDELTELADRHGLPLLFDAAHALGSTHRGRPVGGFGSAEVFSFHATKFINSFEGGALVTDDPRVAERARAMRNFGIGEDREVISSGTNAKMSEASAAMGLVSLERVDALIEQNTRNHRLYEEGLAGLPGISVRGQAPGSGPTTSTWSSRSTRPRPASTPTRCTPYWNATTCSPAATSTPAATNSPPTATGPRPTPPAAAALRGTGRAGTGSADRRGHRRGGDRRRLPHHPLGRGDRLRGRRPEHDGLRRRERRPPEAAAPRPAGAATPGRPMY